MPSIGKQSRESVESVLKKKKEGCGWKDLQKRKVGFKPGMKEWGWRSTNNNKYECKQHPPRLLNAGTTVACAPLRPISYVTGCRLRYRKWSTMTSRIVCGAHDTMCWPSEWVDGRRCLASDSQVGSRWSHRCDNSGRYTCVIRNHIIAVSQVW